MDTQALFSHGGEMVKNPNYSPNNGQPEFINNTDISKNSDGLASTFYKATEEGRNYTITDQDLIRKSKKYGIPLIKEDIESGAIDKELYDAQGRLSKVFNSLEQLIVGEIGLGTLKGFSELRDIIGNFVTGNDIFEESDLTKFVANLQEKNKQAFNINTDPTVHLGSGALGNLGWWASNFPSVGSSLALLIPARAITSGTGTLIQAAGKGINALSKTEKAAKETSNLFAFTQKGKKAIKAANKDNFLGVGGSVKRELRKARIENAVDAALMRTMENYQEAKQVNEDIFKLAQESWTDNENYAEFLNSNPTLIQDLQNHNININDKDAVARYISKRSALQTFALDYANIIFDVFQIASLRNPAKIAKNRIWKGRKINQADRLSLERPRDDIRLVISEQKDLALGKKVSNFLKDTKGAIPTLLSEWSEGVEEAVNYIAQENGMSYGKILLGLEDDKDWSFIPKVYKLKEYMRNPEMWDSAFWGFAGGIGFQIGGSNFNRLTNAISERKADKKAGRKVDSFGEYFKNAENRYRIKDIEKRSASLNDLINKFTLINNNQNPFKPNKNGYEEFKSDLEVKNTKERVINEFIQTLTLSALQAGNYDMLEAYLSNDNVRKALVDSGIFEGSDSSEFFNNVITKMKDVADIYEEQLDLLDDYSKNIREQIPMEYLQMIARSNTLNILDDKTLQMDGEIYQNAINKLRENSDIKDPNYYTLFNQKTKLSVLTVRLAEIQARLKTLMHDDSVKDTINGSIAINNLKKQRELILKEIRNVNLDETASVVWALLQSEGAMLDDDEKLQINLINKDFIKYEGAIRQKDEKLIKELLTNNGLKDLADKLNINEFVTDDKQGTYNLLADALTEYNKEIKSKPQLLKQFQNLEYIKLLQIETKADFIDSSEKLLEQINFINDSFKEVLPKAQQQAENNILKLGEKYGEDKVYNYLFNNKEINNITDEDLALLNDSKDLLNLSDKTLGLNDRLNKKLNEQVINREIKKLQEEEKSSTSENPAEEIDETPPTKPTPEPLKSNTSSENGSSDLSITQNNTKTTSKVEVVINADEENPVSIKEVNDDAEGNNITNAKLNPKNNSITLNIEGTDNQLNLLKSTTLFEGYDNNKENNENYERLIISQPVISITKNDDGSNKYSVKYKGQIEYREKSIKKEEPTDVASSSSTGKVEKPNIDDTDVVPPYSPELVDTPKGQEIQKERNKYYKENIKSLVEQNYDEEAITKNINDHIAEMYKNEDPDILNAVLSETSGLVVSYIVNYKQFIDKDIANAVSTLTDAHTKNSIIEEGTSMPTDIMEAINKILPYYSNKHNLPLYKSKLDGKNKRFVNLKTLLEDLNKVYNNENIIATIYDFVIDYLNTSEGKDKYIITDINLNDPDFLNKVNKKLSEITTESEVTIQDVSSNDLTEKEFNHLIELQPDDILNVEIENYLDKNKVSKERLVLKHDKIKVGIIPLANYKNGVYTFYNQGWKYQLSNDNGRISSNVLDLIVELLQNEDIYNSLLEIRNSNISNTERNKLKKELSDKLKNYKYKNQKLEKTYIFEPEDNITKKTQPYQEVDHLLRLLSFDLSTYTYAEAKDKIRNSIYNFTKKLYNSYSSAQHLYDRVKENQNVTIEINNTLKGIFEPPVKKILSKDDYDNIKQSNVVLQDISNIKLGIQESAGNYSGKVVFNDGTSPEKSIPNLNVGSIIVSIPDKQGRYFNTRALPVKLGDNQITSNSDAAKVIDFIKNELNRRLDDWKQSDENYDSFADLLIKLFYKSGEYKRYINKDEKVKAKDTKNEPLLRGVLLSDLREFGLGIRLHIQNQITIEVNKDRIKLSINDGKEYKHNTHNRESNYDLKYIKKAFDKIINSTYFNISLNLIKDFSPNNNGFITNGLIQTNSEGKCVIKIPSISSNINSEVVSADNYKDLILSGGFVKVNAKKETKTLYQDGNKTEVNTGNFNYNNSKLSIEVPTVVNSTPVGEEMTLVEPTLTPIEKAIRSKRDNAFNKAFRLAGLDKVTVDGKEVNVLNKLKSFGLYSNNIIFEPTLNKRDSYYNYTGPIAKANIDNGKITIGSRWVDMFNTVGRYANDTNRAQAIRKLIHESLHLKFHTDNNMEYVKKLQDVFDEFKKYVLNDSKENQDIYKKYFFEKYKDVDEEGKPAKNADLEEFIVESFTNEELVKYLNTIPAEGYSINNVNKKDRNIFQKILDFLAKIFNWEIKDDKLLAREFVELSKIFTEIKNEQNIEETNQENEEEVKEEPKEISLDDTNTRSTLNAWLSSDNEDEDEERYSTTEENSYTSEMQSIKNKAIDDGTFMKAPNGNPTNLTEKQWLQVRTKAFKDWFGDWENDAANASKVVDENGEPLVVYHGSTDYGFEVFNKSDDGVSYFFTSEKSTAATYVKPYKLEVLNILASYINEDINGIISKQSIIEYVNYYNNEIGDKILKELENIEEKEYTIRDYKAEQKRYNELSKHIIEKYKDTKKEDIPGYNPSLEPNDPWSEYTKNDVLNNLIYEEEQKLPKLYTVKKGIDVSEYKVDESFKIYEVFLNIRNPNIVNGHGSNWNYIYYKGKRYKTREIHKDSINNNNDGTIINDVKDLGGNPKFTKVYSKTIFINRGDNIEAYTDFNHTNLYIAVNSNQIKSATDNNGEFSKTNNNIYYSTIEEYENKNDFINKAKPKDKMLLLNEINDGEISSKCN